MGERAAGPPAGGAGRHDAEVERRTRGRTSPEGSSCGRTPVSDRAALAVAAEAERAAALEASYHGLTLPTALDVLPGTVGCQRCELLPEPVLGPGTLHARFPHSHTLGKVLRFLRGAWAHGERLGTVTVDVPAPDMQTLLDGLAGVLTSLEQRDARVLFQPRGRLLGADDYFNAEPFARFRARAESAWLVDLIRGQEIRSVFQPIVGARAGGGYEVHGYECLMRGVLRGRDVAPGAMLDLARSADLLFQLDLAARRTALLAAARHHVAERVFVNFTPHAVYEPQTCLRSTVALVDELGIRREQIVFEVVETERFDDLAHLASIAGYYREKGFGVALDDVGAGYASLNALVAVRPDYVKLDMALTRGVDTDPVRAVVAAKVLEAARELGLRTVVEGVETAEECGWATAHGADFLQGYYFARPAAPPPAVSPR